MIVVANWRKVQRKVKQAQSPPVVLVLWFCRKMVKGSIDIRPNRFYPNKSATMLITDGHYEIRSDLPWIFGDFDGNRAESLQWRKWRSGFLWKRRKDEVKRGLIIFFPNILLSQQKSPHVTYRLFLTVFFFRAITTLYFLPREENYFIDS